MQVKPDPQCEYVEEEDVKVKTDADPWMTGTAYGRPFPHPGDEAWGQDQSHAMIDISPLLPFETRDLETVDVKEYAWADPEALEATTAPQATRVIHQTRNGRPRDDPLRTTPRDPRFPNKSLLVTPVDKLRDSDGPRIADTTSTDSDGEYKLVIILVNVVADPISKDTSNPSKCSIRP